MIRAMTDQTCHDLLASWEPGSEAKFWKMVAGGGRWGLEHVQEDGDSLFRVAEDVIRRGAIHPKAKVTYRVSFGVPRWASDRPAARPEWGMDAFPGENAPPVKDEVFRTFSFLEARRALEDPAFQAVLLVMSR
jgi:hypothetical protein